MIPAPSAILFRETAEEVRALFDCLRALAGDARDAAEHRDEATLRRALDERDRIAERLVPLLRELGQAPGEAEAAGVVSAALAVQETDARLVSRLAEIRAEVARELDRMEHAGTAAAAYAAPAESAYGGLNVRG